MAKIAPVTFPQQRLELIVGREQSHFWHAPRSRLLLDTIRRLRLPPRAAVVDVGCGSGRLVAQLRELGLQAQGLDPWAAASGLANARVGQAECIPWPDASLAAVFALDVLEHTDDGQALAEMHRVLRPEGRLVLSVPAYGWLWSARDTLAGHRRRYTRRMLRAAVREAGFEVERLFGYQFLLLPMFIASRLLSRLAGRESTASEDQPGWLLNALLRAVNGFEVGVGGRLRPAVGSSLVLVARKPRAGSS